MPREKLDNSSYSTEIFLKYLQNKKMRILSLWFPREGRDMKIQGTDENTHITNNTLHVREFHNTYWFFFFFFFFIELLGRIERNCSWQLCFTYNDGLNYKRDVDNSNFPFWRGTGLIEMNPTNVESMTEYILIHNSVKTVYYYHCRHCQPVTLLIIQEMLETCFRNVDFFTWCFFQTMQISCGFLLIKQ